MNWLPALSPLQWAFLLAVPPAILSLYFLKLRRQPVEVPSTYLWSRTIEDLHVNSIWQKLRQSLLLFLQILVVTLAILACLRPGFRGTELIGDRFIFLIDNSASMSAKDMRRTRLSVAQERVLELIDQMKSSDVAMVISFSDVQRVEQSFTHSRGQLRQRVNRIQPTQRRTDLSDALRAASGLANPGRTSEVGTNDYQVADAMPATLYIYSDGGFASVPDFSLGNLEPVYVSIGEKLPNNVGIVSFSTEQNAEKPTQMQAYARLENSGTGAVTVEVELTLDGEFLDAANVDLPARDEDVPGATGVQFELDHPGHAVLKLEIQEKDDLLLDNIAYSVVNNPRQANVLVVTPGNESLEYAFSTSEAKRIAYVKFEPPATLTTKEHLADAETGIFDLVIYDQCVPTVMPTANTMIIGNVPPIEGWSKGELSPAPVIIDTDPAHPLTQLVQMGDVKWNYNGFSITGPPGSSSLMDAEIGPFLVIGQRDGFEDVALGMDIIGKYADGNVGPKTEWPIRRSFPVFMMNTLRYLGGARTSYSTESTQPGSSINIRSSLPVEQIRVTSPSGDVTTLDRESQNTFVYSKTNATGVYETKEGRGREVSQRFAVNLFSSRESDLRPREEIELGYEKIDGQSASEPARKELWKWLLIFALGVLIFEWYVYNRRVYL
ncbi:MAG: BatA and WFA domain-containing protein [Pirellulaceae bacterium]|nr:BatA and WFA domain-containing protein [Pirellulaceae bacterium]